MVAGLLLWQRTDVPHLWNCTRRFIVDLNSNEVLSAFWNWNSRLSGRRPNVGR